jgi:hypothetical protein
LALSYFSSTLAFTLPIFSLAVAAAFLTVCILSPVQNRWHKSSLLWKQTQNSRPCKILELQKYKRNKQKKTLSRAETETTCDEAYNCEHNSQ